MWHMSCTYLVHHELESISIYMIVDLSIYLFMYLIVYLYIYMFTCICLLTYLLMIYF